MTDEDQVEFIRLADAVSRCCSRRCRCTKCSIARVDLRDAFDSETVLTLLGERDQLRTRLEEQVEYATALGRIIEHAARGCEVPMSFSEKAPYHARILKNHVCSERERDQFRARVEAVEARARQYASELHELDHLREACDELHAQKEAWRAVAEALDGALEIFVSYVENDLRLDICGAELDAVQSADGAMKAARELYPEPAARVEETGSKVEDEDWEEFPEQTGWYWFCGRYTEEHELMFEVLEVVYCMHTDELSVASRTESPEKIYAEGHWIGKWKQVTEPEPPLGDAEMREHMGYAPATACLHSSRRNGYCTVCGDMGHNILTCEDREANETRR